LQEAIGAAALVRVVFRKKPDKDVGVDAGH
jgi:hypothetical protein